MRLKSLPRIFPPRPWGAVPPATLGERGRYEGYWAQYKFNDIRILIEIDPKGEIRLLSRKREKLRSEALAEPALRSLRRLKLARGKRHLLDGGLMRSASPSTGNPAIVLWDILVLNDEYLLGTTYRERYERLEKLAPRNSRKESDTGLAAAIELGNDLWLAATYRDGFDRRFRAALGVGVIEGLMLKNPHGKLEWGVAEENNGSWQIRVRKQNGRHVF